MKAQKVSVIIPTYNRKNYLRDTLNSLSGQTLPVNRFEVIIVDDGSTDETVGIVEEDFPFLLRYYWQPNQGDAIARNLGVQKSQADVLVFLDDDMLVDPNYLSFLLAEHEICQDKVVVGTEFLLLDDDEPPQIPFRDENSLVSKQEILEHDFEKVFSRNMSMWRSSYLKIGMMDNLGFTGSSIWCDVEFNYRALQKGFKFLRSTRAICYHRDHVVRSLESSKRRGRESAYRGAALFQKHPELLPHLPMFHDKTPIEWRQDRYSLILRKIARHIASTTLALIGLEKVHKIFEGQKNFQSIQHPLHRWIIGGYIYRGYRQGLKDFGAVDNIGKRTKHAKVR